MPPLMLNCRRFLNRHANVVDFLGASLLICLCFIILLPKVHESLQPAEEHSHDHQHNHDHNTPHHHHHHHHLPVGEVLICTGFFVFYCIGLSFGGARDGAAKERQPLLTNEKKVATVCCSSTRCPNDQQRETSFKTANVSPIKRKLNADELNENLSDEEDCVFTLNRHHNHHTHSRHHEHPIPNASDRKENYGSMSALSRSESDSRLDNNTKRRLVVEQITITTEPLVSDDERAPDWPLTLKITLFGILLAAVLAVLDMNIQGIIETFKVFKAAATGALLYVAFFLVLPRGPAGCNACAKEET